MDNGQAGPSACCQWCLAYKFKNSLQVICSQSGLENISTVNHSGTAHSPPNRDVRWLKGLKFFGLSQQINYCSNSFSDSVPTNQC